MAKLGDTFLLANPEINSHLFIIISDPAQDPGRIVTANFTSWRADKDQSCVVEIGEHPFIEKRSCVHYGEDRTFRLADYDRFMASGHLRPHDPVNQHLLKRILDGAGMSPFLPLGNRQILVEQGLIDRE
jgi:hypothetical protein